jgi:hypothetical protein
MDEIDLEKKCLDGFYIKIYNLLTLCKEIFSLSIQ